MLVTDSPEVPSPPEDPYPVPGPQEPPVLRPHTVNHPQVLVTEVGAWSREVQTKTVGGQRCAICPPHPFRGETGKHFWIVCGF